MAYSREAIALILDVGQHMGLPANNRNDSYLDLACDSINWILSRKIFTESKDEIALVLFGCDETENPLADAEENQYQNISVPRNLQLPDFDFIKFIQNEIKPTNIQADWLDALVIGVETLREGTEGKKFGLQSITFFSNLGGDFSEDSLDFITRALKDQEIELNIIGPEVRPRDDDRQNSSASGSQNDDHGPGTSGGGASASPRKTSLSKKTDTMIRGEEIIRKLYDSGVEGECYTATEVIPMLSHFQKRNIRPMPWKAQLEIGGQTRVPVCLYLRTKQNKLKQTWRKMDPTNPNADVGMDRTYVRLRPDDNEPLPAAAAAPGASGSAAPGAAAGNAVVTGGGGGGFLNIPTEDEMQVDKEELVKGFKFGTTIVPFSEADLEAMKFRGDGKSFKLLGFAERDAVRRQELVGDGVHYVLGDPTDDAGCVAFSALVAAMKEKDMVGIVRYCYNVRSNPRLGIIIPDTDEDSDMLVWVQIPFEEDYRWYAFPEWSEPGSEWCEPSDTQLKLVDDLIDSMDLSRAKVESNGERTEALDPEEVVNPQPQYIFQCMRHRALYPEQPMPQPEGEFMSQLEPPTELARLAQPLLKKMKTEFKLERVEVKGKSDRTAAEVFQKGDAAAPSIIAGGGGGKRTSSMNGPTPSHSATGAGKTKVGTVDPVKDFQAIILEDDSRFSDASSQLADIIRQFVLTGLGAQYFEKALDTLEGWRMWSCQFQNSGPFNKFLQDFKEELAEKGRPDFWDRVVKRKVCLIVKSECEDSDVSPEAAEELMSQKKPEPLPIPQEEPKDEEDLLDELE